MLVKASVPVPVPEDATREDLIEVCVDVCERFAVKYFLLVMSRKFKSNIR
jgi:hypothetical protein